MESKPRHFSILFIIIRRLCRVKDCCSLKIKQDVLKVNQVIYVLKFLILSYILSFRHETIIFYKGACFDSISKNREMYGREVE